MIKLTNSRSRSKQTVEIWLGKDRLGKVRLEYVR